MKETKSHQKRILFFIGGLVAGGKERRLIELLTYLKKSNKYDILLVLAFDKIEYPGFYVLNINCRLLNKKSGYKDPFVFFTLDTICKEFKPDILHAWGSMQVFYLIPTSKIRNIPLINSQITDAPPVLLKWSFSYLVNKLNFKFSDIILSNSHAGLKAYKVESNIKSRVIYNGINLERFFNLPDISEVKKEFKIDTIYTVLMVASFTKNKDYDLFFKIANTVTSVRRDISFIGVGGHRKDDSEFKRLKKITKNNPQIILHGKINNVETLVNACDIGVLFSNMKVHGEGISNSIIEYMALSKPVIANDAGGTSEILKHKMNGYLATDESIEELSELIIKLIDDPVKRLEWGKTGRSLVYDRFTLERMGKEFIDLYNDIGGVI